MKRNDLVILLALLVAAGIIAGACWGALGLLGLAGITGILAWIIALFVAGLVSLAVCGGLLYLWFRNSGR